MRRWRWNLSAVVLGGFLAFSLGGHARGQKSQKAVVAHVLAVWAAGPFEVKVVFDRPVGNDLAKSIVGKTISFQDSDASARTREPIRPEHRFKNFRGEPLYYLRIAAARLKDAGRTLVVTTDPHPRDSTYQLSLPIEPHNQVLYDLSGVEVTWTDEEKTTWKGWWPTLDPITVHDQLSESPEHARSLLLLDRKGKLLLETLVTLPKGPVSLTLKAPIAIEATLNGESPKTENQSTVFRTESTGEPMLLSVGLVTGTLKQPLTLKLSAKAANAPAMPVGREKVTSGSVFPVEPSPLLLPWTPAPPPPVNSLENAPDLAGGDPQRGAIVFESAEAKCATCHKVRGKGGDIGPDLSLLYFRDRKEVYRDIAEPSARIHPQFVSYTVALKDGRVLVGTVRAEGSDAIRITDTDAKVTTVPHQIEEFRPAAASVMPVGLPGVIGEQKLRDLIAFLTTNQKP